jgi:hypothetical protein
MKSTYDTRLDARQQSFATMLHLQYLVYQIRILQKKFTKAIDRYFKPETQLRCHLAAISW